MPVSEEQQSEESREFLPLSSSSPCPFHLVLPLLLSSADPILGLNMGYFSYIQPSEGDALVAWWCPGENRIPGRFKQKSQAQKSLEVTK